MSTTIDNKVHCFVWLDNKPVFFVNTLFDCTTYTTVPMDLPDETQINISCPEAIKAYNEHMGGVDLADQMRRFYTCIHKSSCRWYLQQFWFIIDLAIDNAYILECCIQDRTPCQGRHNNKPFHKKLATELLSKHSSQKIVGHQVQNAPARLSQWHFPDSLETDGQCVACSKEHTRNSSRYGCKDSGNVHLCVSPCFRTYHIRL